MLNLINGVQYGLVQLLKEPTSILKIINLCIDLIFTNQPNVVGGFGMQPSSHEYCNPPNN